MIFFGRIIKARGIKGEIVLDPSPRVNDEDAAPGRHLSLRSEKHEFEKEILASRRFKGQLLMRLRDVDSLAAALKLVGYDVYGDVSPRGSEGPSLVGYDVWDTAGARWGRVAAVHDKGLNPLLEVVSDERHGPISIPLVSEIIKEVDAQGKKILIDPPAGLRELNP